MLRPPDEPHGGRIGDGEIQCDAGIVLGPLLGFLDPQPIDLRQHVGLVNDRNAGHLLLFSQLEAVAEDPLGSLLRHDPDLVCKITRRLHVNINLEASLVELPLQLHSLAALIPGEASPEADVEVLAVLADHIDVDVVGLLPFQRRLDTAQEFGRPQVDVLVEVEAHPEERPRLSNRLRPRGSPTEPK